MWYWCFRPPFNRGGGVPGSPRGRGFIPRGGGGGTPPRPPYFPRGSPRGGGRGGRAGGGEDWRRGAGPEYEEYTERGGSRGASPGSRYTWSGNVETREDEVGLEYGECMERGSSRGALPGGRDTQGRRAGARGRVRGVRVRREAAPGEHHPEVGTPGEGGPGSVCVYDWNHSRSLETNMRLGHNLKNFSTKSLPAI